MSYTYGFFDAVDLGDGNYDRVYSSIEFSHYWALLVGDGVFGQPSTSLNVLAITPVAMSIKVSPGSGWIKGHYLTVPDNMDEVIAVPVANPSLPRIDSIIMALNNTDRDMKLYLRSGNAAASPKPVTLQRDADVWELELAQITVAAGAGNITQTAIKDMRTDPNRCGIVTGLIDQFDVSGFFTAAQASFNEWFANVQNQLGDDVAGNLLNLINGLDARVGTLETELQETNSSIQELNTQVSNQAGLVKNSKDHLKRYYNLIKMLNVSQMADVSTHLCGLSPDREKLVYYDGSFLQLIDPQSRGLSPKASVSLSSLNKLWVYNDLVLALESSGTLYIYRLTKSSLTLAATKTGLGWNSTPNNASWYIPKDDPNWAMFCAEFSDGSTRAFKVNKSTLDVSQVSKHFTNSWSDTAYDLPYGDSIITSNSGAFGSGTRYYYRVWRIYQDGTVKTLAERDGSGGTPAETWGPAVDPEKNEAYASVNFDNSYTFLRIDLSTNTIKSQANPGSARRNLWWYGGVLYNGFNYIVNPLDGSQTNAPSVGGGSGFQFVDRYGFSAETVYPQLFYPSLGSLLFSIDDYGITTLYFGDLIELGGVKI